MQAIKKAFTKPNIAHPEFISGSSQLDPETSSGYAKFKKGFTLVELSIVLVIIGLLIGGILVAQSLIDSARIQKFVRTLDQIDAAVMLFDSKYRKLPGDSPHHSEAGDGDGRIENSQVNSGGQLSFGSFNYEIANFWRHLQQDGFLKNEYSEFSNDASVTGLVPKVHYPTINLGEEGAIIVQYDDRHAATTDNFKQFYYICKFAQTLGDDDILSTRSGFIKPVDAFAIDKKIDDGIANGNNWHENSPKKIFAWGGESAGCTTGASYNLNSDANACCLRIRLDLDYRG